MHPAIYLGEHLNEIAGSVSHPSSSVYVGSFLHFASATVAWIGSGSRAVLSSIISQLVHTAQQRPVEFDTLGFGICAWVSGLVFSPTGSVMAGSISEWTQQPIK
jgi:hypothetical protein